MGTAHTCGWGPTLPVRPPCCAATPPPLPPPAVHPSPCSGHHWPTPGLMSSPSPFLQWLPDHGQRNHLCLFPAPPATPMKLESAPFQFQIPPPQPQPWNVESSFHHRQQNVSKTPRVKIHEDHPNEKQRLFIEHLLWHRGQPTSFVLDRDSKAGREWESVRWKTGKKGSGRPLPEAVDLGRLEASILCDGFGRLLGYLWLVLS